MGGYPAALPPSPAPSRPWTGWVRPGMGFLLAAICLAVNVAVTMLFVFAHEHSSLIDDTAVVASVVATTALLAVLGLVSHLRTLSLVGMHRDHVAELEELAQRDELSGLYNFRFVREWMAAAMQNGETRTYALVLIDLDNFKEINDRFGHAVGDQLISAIGQAITDRVERIDGLAARYGGDEFAVVLPAHDRARAVATAEDIRRDILSVSRTATRANSHIAVDACFGVAACPDDAGDLDALIVNAHRALDDAKLHNEASDERLSERHAQEVFFSIGEAMGKSLDPQTLVTNLVNAVGATLGADSCTLWLIDDERLSPRASYLMDPSVGPAFAEIHRPAPMTRDEAVSVGFLKDDAVYVDDVQRSDVLPTRYHTLVRPNTWMIVVPLSGEVDGAMTLTAVHDRLAPPSLSLARAIGRLAASAVQNARVYRRAVRHHEQLASLAGIGGLLFGEGDFEARLRSVVQRIAEVTGSDMLTLDTSDPAGEKPYLRAFYYKPQVNAPVDANVTREWVSVRPQLEEESIASYIAGIRQPMLLDDPPNQVPEIFRDVVRRSGTRTAVIVPAMWEDELKGLVYFASFRRNAFDEHDIALMSSIVAQLAPALQVARLNAEIEHSYDELKAAHTQALLRLAYAAEARDPYTECHLTRIKRLSQAIAERMGIDADELEAIGYGAIVHDLGKLRIPDSILCNPGSLSDDEWTTMKRHPEWGAEIIGDNSFYDVAREVALCHHERWDGSGYPRGLAGDQIPLAARIVSVADVYDALTSARPYKKAWPVERALVELMRMRAKTLCPHSVDTFMQLWNEGLVAAIDAETLDESLEQDFRALFAA